MKVTIDLADEELWRAIKIEATRRDRAVRDVVEEALHGWLERVEDAEDVEAAASAVAEYERDGGVDASDFFARRVAEARARYDPSRG